MATEYINKKKLGELIGKVPDIGNPEETCISYWQKVGDKMLYLEGWADACLAGTGFPLMEEGGTAGKIAYMEDLTEEILPRKAKERGLKLLEGGFQELEDATNLYGVTWGIFEKVETTKMPRINPHAAVLKQDEQLREQLKWLKGKGFKTAREAQEAGH